MGGAAPGGALVFSCNGRGTRMFTSPHHDATAIAEELDRIPAAGLFCNGEIGPVGGKSFVHGFTATMAVFTVDARGGG
jgi:small ligand-binding sensory domain FIST